MESTALAASSSSGVFTHRWQMEFDSDQVFNELETINDKLSWNNHIDYNIQKKANNSLNFIHRNFKNCSSHVKEKLYKAYG